MRSTVPVAVLGVSLIAWPGSTSAQETTPLITDRPDFTESAVTVGRGRLQVESGYSYVDEGEVRTHAFGEILGRVGVLSWLEGRIGLNSFAVSTSAGGTVEGLEDVNLGFKATAYEPPPSASRAAPATAVIVGVTLPTGSEAITPDDPAAQPGGLVALAWSLANRLSLGANVGWRYGSLQDARFHEWRTSASLGIGISDRVGGFAEWYGVYPEAAGGSAANVLNGGLTFLMSPDVQVDGRVGVGLESDPDRSWFTGLGLAFRL